MDLFMVASLGMDLVMVADWKVYEIAIVYEVRCYLQNEGTLT